MHNIVLSPQSILPPHNTFSILLKKLLELHKGYLRRRFNNFKAVILLRWDHVLSQKDYMVMSTMQPYSELLTINELLTIFNLHCSPVSLINKRLYF